MLTPTIILGALLWYACGVFGLYKDWNENFPQEGTSLSTWTVIAVCAIMGPFALLLWYVTCKDKS